MSKRFLIALGVCLSAQATTLEKLPLDSLVRQSTQIVRARAVSQGTERRGTTIYTTYSLEVAEVLKGQAAPVTVAVPGGKWSGWQQTFAGAPHPTLGTDYVFFLWTGRSGLTQIMGLSQGLMQLTPGTKGSLIATQQSSEDAVMLEPDTGRTVRDIPIRMAWGDLKRYVRSQSAARVDQ